MKTLDVRQYVEENRLRFSRGRRLPARRERVRRRPRTPDSYATLSAMVRGRWRMWTEQGRVEVLGPRHYRLRLSAAVEREAFSVERSG